jgi:serine protease Do
MRSDRGRYLAVLAILLTLGVGILIGSLVSWRTLTSRREALGSDPTPLPPPSPVKLSNSFAGVVARVEPAVVNINTESIIRVRRSPNIPPGNDPFGGLFGHLFRGPGAPRGIPERSLGSGIILDANGYILTNDHVITRSYDDRPVDHISVTLYGADSTRYTARVIGTDRLTDLAVIKIDAQRLLPYAQLGDSSSMQVGDWVLAIGSPFELKDTVTAGIISARGREIEPGAEGQFKRFLQTDAAINPGNSGGPLVNLAGQVIGINTAIETSDGSSDGIGFAIPSNTARKVYNSLITSGRVRRGAIGVMFDAHQSAALLRSFGANHGVVVNSVEPGSPAARAGLKLGDVITAISGHPVRSGDQLVRIISSSPIGKPVEVDYLRNGKSQTASVVVGDRDQIVAENEQAGKRGRNRAAPGEAEGALGVTVQNLTPQQFRQLDGSLHLGSPQGIVVSSVDPSGVAADMGVVPGDTILSINHRTVRSLDDFMRFQAALKPGQDVLLLIARRSGRQFEPLFLADTLPAAQ